MKKIKVSSKRRYNRTTRSEARILKNGTAYIPSERAETGGRATEDAAGGARGGGMVVYGLN